MAVAPFGAAVVTALLIAFAPAGASADVPSQPITPITIGDGNDAFVTVDEAGTAHIAWDGNESNFNSLHYCTLPRGATACTVNTTLPSVGQSNSLERPFVVANGNTVQVLSYRYGLPGAQFSGDILFTSTDGGATFDAGTYVGLNPFYEAALGPGNGVSTVTDAETGGMSYQRVPLDGTSAGSTRATFTDFGYSGAVGLLDASTPLIIREDASDNAVWSKYTGTGDPNDVNNWTAPQPVGARRHPVLAGGPSGLFLISGDESTREETVSLFTGNGFSTPVAVPGGGGETPQAWGAEDPGGRLQVLLPQITANGSRLLYATSDDGKLWAARQLAFEPFAGNPYISAASDHRGYAVWEGGNRGSTSIFATPIGPSAAVPTTAKFVEADVVTGTVLIETPGAKQFKQLKAGDVIPVGSLVDATNGRVRVTIALPNGALQFADFFQGIFQVTQAKSGAATMVLAGGSFAACRGRGAAVHAAKAKVIRQLWGDGKGKFATKGRFAAATIRGTTWDTVDRCDGTLIKVKSGSVLVTDFKAHKKVVVKAGHSYLAKR